MTIWKFQKPSDSLLVTEPAREIPSTGWELFDAVRMGEMFTTMSTSRRRTTNLTLKSLDADERYRKLTGENFPILEDDMEAAFQRARELDETFPDYEEFIERRSRIAKYYLNQAAKAQTYTTTDWPVAISMAAAAAQGVQDPMVLASMLAVPASIPGAFAAGVAMEIPLQGMVYQWHKDIGAEYSQEKALATALAAGALGAGFEGVSRLFGRSIDAVSSRMGSNDKPYQLPPPRKPSQGRGPSPASDEPIVTEPPPRGPTFEEASGPEAEPIVPEPPPRAGAEAEAEAPRAGAEAPKAEQTFEEASGPEAEPIIPPRPSIDEIAAASVAAKETRENIEMLSKLDRTPDVEEAIKQEQQYLAELEAIANTPLTRGDFLEEYVPTEGIQKVQKKPPTEDEIFLQAEVSAEVQKYIQGDSPDSPFKGQDLGKGFSYLEEGQKAIDETLGTGDTPTIDNAPMNSIAGRENVPPASKIASEEEAMKNMGDDPNVQNAKKLADVVSKCNR